jgi:hypothetical protein
VIVLALQIGCTTQGLPIPDVRAEAERGKVEVGAVYRAPAMRFEGMALKDPPGPDDAFMSCMEALGNAAGAGGCIGCLLFHFAWIPACGAGTLVKAAEQGLTPPPRPNAEARRAADRMMTDLNTKLVQDSLRDEVLTAALVSGTRLVPVTFNDLREANQPLLTGPRAGAPPGDSRYAFAQGRIVLMETILSEVGTMRSGGDTDLLVGYMKARVSLLRVRDSAEFDSASYLFVGERLTADEWLANKGERLLSMVHTGYAVLGSQLYEHAFLLYPFPDREPQAAGAATVFGLAPLIPGMPPQPLTESHRHYEEVEWTTVAGLQPTLSWQAFPRDQDIAASAAEMARVKSVRYDLLVAREHRSLPAEIVYRREGLPGPVHTVETPLAPGTRYFWTVRARFELDGHTRVTEWSTIHTTQRGRVTSPSGLSYLFRTPG